MLAGGQSRRFGSDKTALFRDHIVTVLTETLGQAPLIIGPSGIPDLRPGQGPLAGIEAAFDACTDTELLVVACDLPGLDAAVVRHLATYPADADVVLPRVGDRLHPLCARWHRRTAPAIRAALNAGRRSVHGVLEGLDVRVLEASELAALGVDPERAVHNVNRPEDLW